MSHSEVTNHEAKSSNKLLIAVLLVLVACICFSTIAICCFIMFINTLYIGRVDNRLVNSIGREQNSPGMQNTTTKPSDNGVQNPSGIELESEAVYEGRNLYFDITDLDLMDDQVLMFEIQTNTGKALASSSEFIFNPEDVLVDSLGNATLEFKAYSFEFLPSDAPLSLVLIELVPDSLGNPTKFELGSQVIRE